MIIKIVEKDDRRRLFECTHFEFKDGQLLVTMKNGTTCGEELRSGAYVYVMNEDGKTVDKFEV